MCYICTVSVSLPCSAMGISFLFLGLLQSDVRCVPQVGLCAPRLRQSLFPAPSQRKPQSQPNQYWAGHLVAFLAYCARSCRLSRQAPHLRRQVSFLWGSPATSAMKG